MTSAAARRAAQHILGESRFRTRRLPEPLHGIFVTLGRWLAPVGRAVSDAGVWIGRAGFGSVWRVAASVAVILLLSSIGAVRLRRRRPRSRAVPRGTPAAADPGALRRQARQAESDGRWTEAYRLYFAAGLVELQRIGRLRAGEAVTVGAARRAVGAAPFEEAADRFEAAAYGSHEVDRPDLELVRRGWVELAGRQR